MPIEGLTSYVNRQPAASRGAIMRKYTSPRRTTRHPARYTSYSSKMPKRYKAPSRGRTSGGSSGNQYRESSGGQRGGVGLRGGARSVGSATSGGPGAIKTIAPTLSKFLAGDTAYQQTIRQGGLTLKDFLNELNRNRTEAGVSYGQTTKGLETERVRALKAMEDDYAARGMLTSGLYGEAVGDYQSDYAKRLQELSQAQTSLLSDFTGQETNFKREQQLALEAARQEAARRRAAQYGLV